MNIQSSIVLFLLSVSWIGIECGPILGEDYSIGKSGELGDYFEGDLILNEAQIKAINGEPNRGRTGLIDTVYRWSTTVPYQFGPGFNIIQRAQILLAMTNIQSVTCLTFRAKTEVDEDYIFFNSDTTGCSSYVGRQGGENTINLGSDILGLGGCFENGIIVHEIIHALGFFHMQSASDRDLFVEIKWENIISGKENNFQSYDDTVITHFGIPYDYNSVMHYAPTAFSVNGNPTIVPFSSAPLMGQRLGMTSSDIARINAMYCSSAEPVQEPESEPEFKAE